MTSDGAAGVYEERFGFDRRSTTIIVGCLAFALATLVLDLPLVVRIVGLVFFGGGALVLLFGALSRRVALRVDARGVTLGGTPVRYAAGTAVVPWSEITDVALWTQAVPMSQMRYVGVLRKPGLPPVQGAPGSGRLGASMVPVSGDLLKASRPINGWRLDRGALEAAIAVHAPGVQVRELAAEEAAG